MIKRRNQIDELYGYFSTNKVYIPPKEVFRSDLIPSGRNLSIRLGDYYPLPYSEESRIRIQKYLEDERLVPYLPNEAIDLSPAELNQLNYLLLSLNAFYSQKNSLHYPRNELVPKIMTSEGAKFLKRQKLKSFLVSNKSSLLETPDWWKEVPDKFIEDIGEIYNYNYAMFWECPDEQDYLMSQLPVNRHEETALEFIQFINEISENWIDFQEVPSEEILLRVNSSKSLYKEESVPNYTVKHKVLHFSDKRKAGKRVLITTGPGQGRDAIINTVEDLNTIQLINENVREFLLKNYSEFMLIGSTESCKKKFFNRCRKSSGFYCRDIKKEGITKPKWILNEILKVLNKRYKENSAFHYTDFYSGPWFEGDKGDRGHGLGMANELTTLMQILLFLFTNKKLGDEGFYIASKRAFFLNDDAVIFFNEDPEWGIEDFADTDFDLCEKLGILAQKDKSFISRTCCVFCEMYYSKDIRTMNDKESYVLRESSIILRAGSILECKFYLGNLKCDLEVCENLLKTCYIKYGYEFSPREIDWPISCGGLRPTYLRGTDFALKFLENESDIRVLTRSYEANSCKRLWNFSKFTKLYNPPILKIYPALAYADSDLLSRLGIISDFESACRFFRPTKEHKFHSSLKKLEKKRANIFNNQQGSPTFEQFCELYSQSSFNNVALFTHQHERYIKVKLFKYKNFRDPYTVKNPISCFLNMLFKKNENQPSTTWGLYQSDASILHEKSVFARARSQNTLSLMDRFEDDFEYDLLVFPENPEDIPDFMESYPKPFLTSELVINGNLLPIPKPKFRNKELIRRLEVYNCYLQYRHIILAQTCQWNELIYILTFEKMNLHKFEFSLDFWEVVLERVHQSKKDEIFPPKEGSSSSSSDDEDDPFGVKISFIKLSDIQYTFAESERISIPEKPQSDSEESEPEVVEEIIPIKTETNPFMKDYGALADSDESVYGSLGWVKWFVSQSFVSDLQEYLDSDEDLKIASVDFLQFKVGVNTASHMAEIQARNEMLRSNLVSSSKYSWISHYFLEYISQPEPDDEVEFDVFG